MTQIKNKYAVVDLEALNPGSTAKIIQVGIVIIENGQIVQTYETDVNPQEPLDTHIKELTGLTDERLAIAPDFSQVAREIYNLIEDCIFVAHNVKFDADLLAEALFWEGFELLTPRVDTVELSQVFYPFIEKYNLSMLADDLGLDLDHAHTAMSDAKATAQLFLKIQEKIRSLPKMLVEQILKLSDSLVYETRLAIEEVFVEMSDLAPTHLQEINGLFLRLESQNPPALKLSQQFETNMALLGLDVREKQDIFANAVESSLSSSRPSFLQAQTGIGKTYAYLLPLLAKTDKKIVISVPTKILQDQLVYQDGKRVSDVFQMSIHSLKGPDNYIKLDSFYEVLQREDDNRLFNRFKISLLIWLTETVTGDLSEIGQLQRYEHFLSELRHDGKLASHSLFLENDFWNRGQKKARSARVLVTNHAYLLTRLEDDPSLVEGSYLVVDEAQKMLGCLEAFSRRKINLNKLLQQIHIESQQAKTVLEKRLMESIQYELNMILEDFHLVGNRELELQHIQQLRQDLSEIDLPVLHNLRDALSDLFSDWWLEEERFDHHRLVWLHASRPDLLNFQEFLPENIELIFVSATLEISRKVDLATLLGFQEADFYRIEEERDNSQLIVVDQEFPNVTNLSIIEYARLIVERLESLARLEKPMLVLFTAKDLLYEVSEQLQLPHLAQGKNGEASSLKKRFERGESHILLGTGSFWEGVDFARADQMIEVISRLPFENPQDPFVKKISKQLRKEGKNPFYDYSLPVMLLKLRQAIGRTNRREKQKSAVVILDSRMLTKRYSRQIKENLSHVAPLKWGQLNELLATMDEFFKVKIEEGNDER